MLRNAVSSQTEKGVWRFRKPSHAFGAECAPFVGPNVVDQHSLGKNCGGIWVAGPCTADCDVENQKKWVVKDPGFALGQIRRRPRFVQAAINIEAYYVRLPLNGKDMVVI